MAIPMYWQQIEATQRKLWAQREHKLRMERFREFENQGSIRPMDNSLPDMPIDPALVQLQPQCTTPAQWIINRENRTRWEKFTDWFMESIWNPIFHRRK